MTTEHIYELRYKDNNVWHTFYCGRTVNIDKRKQGHKSSSKKGHTDVYCFIRDLEFVNLQWDIFSVSTHIKENYTDEEDNHILELLFQNVDLMNMKKGDAKWMERLRANISKAKKAGCSSVKEFKEWDRVQRQVERDEKAAKRIEEESKTPLIDRIKAQTKFTDAQKLRVMEAEAADRKANDILNQIKR